MSVRHLESSPSADWGEIWFPVLIGLHPPGRVRKWVRAQNAATALVTLFRILHLSVTPNFGYEVIGEEKGSDGSFLSAHEWRPQVAQARNMSIGEHRIVA